MRDWCGWCVKLDEEVFSKADFKRVVAEEVTTGLDLVKRRRT